MRNYTRLFWKKEVGLFHDLASNAYMIITHGMHITIDAEQLDDLVAVVEVAKNHRDHGILPDVREQ